ncbi:unnamed protein product [Wuchereria bancrofti]|uniref:Uncharacterized protein n=1 Tax=Wuchereria bancrofti TaxID=6293 RepID=A0A3P7E883_WUCBA|nr:unnamed protein product [Wuchereria bancrofti]
MRLGNEDEFSGSKGFNYPSLSIKRCEFRRKEIQQVEKYNGKNNILAINGDVQATIKPTTVTTLNNNSRIKKKREEGKQHTKAVHLEMAKSLSAENFLHVLRRLVDHEISPKRQCESIPIGIQDCYGGGR